MNKYSMNTHEISSLRLNQNLIKHFRPTLPENAPTLFKFYRGTDLLLKYNVFFCTIFRMVSLRYQSAMVLVPDFRRVFVDR